jgi:AcrR family transcriptional regulator
VKPSVRERLLDAADELFYEEGVRTVGIDKVIERAGVAKASLYSTFGSKDELVRAYLTRRREARQERLTAIVAAHPEPRAKILAIYDSLAESSRRPGFKGCAFINASAEAPAGSAAEQVTDELRGWVRALFRDLATQAGAADPEQLANQLFVLYDGAIVGARLDHAPIGMPAARAAAAALIDAACASTAQDPNDRSDSR